MENWIFVNYWLCARLFFSLSLADQIFFIIQLLAFASSITISLSFSLTLLNNVDRMARSKVQINISCAVTGVCCFKNIRFIHGLSTINTFIDLSCLLLSCTCSVFTRFLQDFLRIAHHAETCQVFGNYIMMKQTFYTDSLFILWFRCLNYS